MKEKLTEETIALRVAKEFKDGDCVNLGLGIPNLCSLFIPEGRTVLFQSENGVLGRGIAFSQFGNEVVHLVDCVDAEFRHGAVRCLAICCNRVFKLAPVPETYVQS